MLTGVLFIMCGWRGRRDAERSRGGGAEYTKGQFMFGNKKNKPAISFFFIYIFFTKERLN